MSSRGVKAEFSGQVFFEGWPTGQPSLSLDDFGWALLGVYDMTGLDPRAPRLFDLGHRALRWGLPHWDRADGRTNFDLSHLVRGTESRPSDPFWQHFHHGLVDLFNTIRPAPALARYARRWAATDPLTSPRRDAWRPGGGYRP